LSIKIVRAEEEASLQWLPEELPSLPFLLEEGASHMRLLEGRGIQHSQKRKWAIRGSKPREWHSCVYGREEPAICCSRRKKGAVLGIWGRQRF
jgi:hypothetical protein